MNTDDICIVVQGPTNSSNVNRIKECWNGFNLIFSTWEGSDKTCYNDTDIVLYNKNPQSSGTMNINYQKISSLNGFLKAKELGFKRVLKWRSDFITNNSKKLLNLFDEDFLSFYSFQTFHRDGYITDFLMEGNVDELISIFSFDFNPPYPEWAFTKQVYNLGLDKKVKFICKKLVKDDVDIFWIKRNYWLSDNSKYRGYADKLPEVMNPNYK